MSSVAGAGPLWRIDGPLPLAPRFGLLQAASAPPVRIIPDADGEGVERWLNGVTVRPYPTDEASVFDAGSLCGTNPDSKAEGDEIPLPVFSPFTVYLPISCTSRQVGDHDAFKARAVAALEAVQGAAVEAELLVGAGLGLANPFLADGNGTFPDGSTLVSPTNGLALLEGEIAASGRQGLIHVSPKLATTLHALQLIGDFDRDGVLETVNGTVVIPGYGYTAGASPAGHTAASGTQEWAYATGPIDIRRSEIFVNPETRAQAVDRETNEVIYRAERYYLVNWDTVVQAAVRIDRCQTTC